MLKGSSRYNGETFEGVPSLGGGGGGAQNCLAVKALGQVKVTGSQVCVAHVMQRTVLKGPWFKPHLGSRKMILKNLKKNVV